jgi:hypothetical protein
MSCQLNLTADAALTIIEEIKPRHRFAMLVAVLGLAALASTGASACGRLPAGVELSGPVLRGGVTPHGVQAQPIIMPHCNLTPTVDGIEISAAPDRPDNSGASSVGRLAAPN